MAVLEGLCAREAVKQASAEDLAELEAVHQRLEAFAVGHDIDGYYEENFRFHEAVQTMSRNPWLQRVVADLRRIMRLARHEQLLLPGRLQDSLNEHRSIMEAFRHRDPALADRCMQEHLTQQCIALERLHCDQEKAHTA